MTAKEDPSEEGKEKWAEGRNGSKGRKEKGKE